jgi:hypothetical protein
MITAVDTARRTPDLANVRILGQTVRRKLRESGLEARRSVIGPILKQRHRTARLAWARARRRWRLKTWQHILFSDESRFPLFEILDPIILSFLQQRNFDHGFQHDNGRCYLARVCQDFLNHNHIRVLPRPAISPDLLPFEHLWDELGRRVRHRQNPTETLQELRDAPVHQWNNIPQSLIQRLIGSMRRRYEAVVAARGGHTRY